MRRIAYYEKGMMDFEKEQQELLVGVERAVENEEFEIWFQPQVDYQNGVMTGAEALIRWRHPTMGLLSADLLHTASREKRLHRCG